MCFTLSRTSARFALLNRSTVPTRYPVIRRMRSNFTPSPTLPSIIGKWLHSSLSILGDSGIIPVGTGDDVKGVHIPPHESRLHPLQVVP